LILAEGYPGKGITLRMAFGAASVYGGGMTNTVWKCEQLRAGQVTNRVVFETKEQAARFVEQMRRVEPDLVWRMEPVEAVREWN
jgi:hypothetical protein